jgi:uncharacterized protein involved in exopolysaccharide biosynthesis
VDFARTIGVLARRWYATVPAFLLVVAVAGLVVLLTPHQYESTGTVVLSEPDPASALADHSLGANQIANPLLSFPDSLVTDSTLLIQSLNSPDTADQLSRRGGTARLTASDGKLTGPFIVVTADATSPDAVRRTVTLALDYARQELVRRQHELGAPEASYIVVKDVVPPSDPALKMGGKTRLALAVGVLSVSAALCAAYAAETYAGRRHRVRATA